MLVKSWDVEVVAVIFIYVFRVSWVEAQLTTTGNVPILFKKTKLISVESRWLHRSTSSRLMKNVRVFHGQQTTCLFSSGSLWIEEKKNKVILEESIPMEKSYAECLVQRKGCESFCEIPYGMMYFHENLGGKQTFTQTFWKFPFLSLWQPWQPPKFLSFLYGLTKQHLLHILMFLISIGYNKAWHLIPVFFFSCFMCFSIQAFQKALNRISWSHLFISPKSVVSYLVIRPSAMCCFSRFKEWERRYWINLTYWRDRFQPKKWNQALHMSLFKTLNNSYGLSYEKKRERVRLRDDIIFFVDF